MRAAATAGAAAPVAVVHTIAGRVRLRMPRLAREPGFGPGLVATLAVVPGVVRVRVTSAASSAVVEHDPARIDVASILRIAACCAAAESLPAPAPTPEAPRADEGSKRALYLSSAGMFLAVATGGLAPLLAAPFILATATPIFRRATRVIRHERRLNVDLLDGLAVVAAVATRDVVNAAGIVWLVCVGDHIRDLTQARARRAIRDLLSYQKDLAWVVRDGLKVRVPVAELRTGDVVVVYTGSAIPVDGEVIEGEAVVDQQSLTGESVPAPKAEGDRCFAATVITEGKLYIRADRVAGDTNAARTVRLVEEAPTHETRAQNYAELMADRLVLPSICCAALVLALTGDMFRVAAILTIDFGTGPRVSAPTAILASMSAAARRGILIKGGAHLEKLSRVSTVVFDKTGTLTHGAPEVTDVIVHGELSALEVVTLAAAASARQTHPVSRAVIRHAESLGLAVPERETSRFLVGRGVEATVAGRLVQLGSARYLAELGAARRLAGGDAERLEEQAKSLLFLAVDGEHVATFAHQDRIRDESRAVIRALRARGIDDIVMLTGDGEAAARAVARELQITRYFAEMLPEGKAERTRALRSEGRIVAVVGDGINDSPALSYADVGVSVRAGAEIAREAAGVVLVEDDLGKLVEAIDVARGAMGTIRQNNAMTLGVNGAAYALAIPGLISPLVATLVSSGTAVLACLNGVRPLLGQRRRARRDR